MRHFEYRSNPFNAWALAIVGVTSLLSAATTRAGDTVALRPAGPEFTISDPAYEGLEPTVGAIAPGEFAVLWTRSGFNTQILVAGRRVNPFGPLAPERVVSQVPVDGSASAEPSIVGTPNGAWGEWIAVWAGENDVTDSYLDIFGIQLDADLAPLSSVFQVNNVITDFDQLFPEIVASDNGDFFVVWYDRGHNLVDEPRANVEGRFYHTDGIPITNELTVAATADGLPFAPRTAAFTNEGVVATWSTVDPDYDVYFRFYHGGDAYSATRANAQRRGIQDFSDVATCRDGRFVVVWQSGSPGTEVDGGIYGQWFDLNGNAGERIHINQHTQGFQRIPTVATTPDCQAVVLWQSNGQDGDGEGIYGRIVNPDGSFATDEFRVNESTAGNQGVGYTRAMAVVADSDRSFFAAWQSDPLSDGNWQIVGRGFCWLTDSSDRVCGNATCAGDPVGGESSQSINATDALTALRTAVGLDACSPCRCDVDRSGQVTTDDALRILRAALALPVQLDCEPCA